MTREEFEILDSWVYTKIKMNRDYYSRAKIIEMIMERAEELVNENDSLHLVSERYFKIEFTNVWGSFKEAIVKATNKNTAYAEFKMKHGDQVNIIAVNDYAR